LQFPSVSADCSFIQTSGVHALSLNTELVGANELTMLWLNSSLIRFSLNSKQDLLELRRDIQPWTGCRPRWWPSLHNVILSKDWKTYSELRSNLLNRKIQKHPPVTKSLPAYDYDVYTSVQMKTPAYRLFIKEPSFGQMDLFLLAQLSENMPTAPLLVATGTVTSFKLSRLVTSTEGGPRLEDTII